MTSAVLPISPIPGLHAPPSIADLQTSAAAYNLLPDDEDQPLISDVHLDGISSILRAFGVESKFGIHLVHGHLQVEAGKVMLGKAMSGVNGCWTRPTSISGLDLSNLHGHVFMLDDNDKFTPYEFREGPTPRMSDVDNAFVVALQAYLSAFGLTKCLGLEVLGDAVGRSMYEIVFGDGVGTVMMDQSLTKGLVPYRHTGWSFNGSDNGIRELKGQPTAHAKRVNGGNHQVFFDSKALGDEPMDERVVLDTLRKEGIID